MSGYLSKPFKAHELFAVVEGWAAPEANPALTPAPRDPVDLKAFRGILSEAGMETAADQMLRVFLEYSGERIAPLADAARRGDLDEVARVAHMLKSGAGTIHANRLSDLFRQAETAALAVDSATVSTLADDIRHEYLRVVDFLTAQLADRHD